MRNIKFRGKTPEGKWVYGNLLNEQTIGEVGNNLSHYRYSTVIPETVGQFTGFKDNRDNDIYDGDLVKAKGFVPETYRIEFIEGGFCLTNPDLNGYPTDINIMYPSYGCQIEVIGNIHDKETEANHG